MRLPRFRVRTLMISVAVVGVLLAFEPVVFREVGREIGFGPSHSGWGRAVTFLVVSNVVLFVVGVNIGLILLGIFSASENRRPK